MLQWCNRLYISTRANAVQWKSSFQTKKAIFKSSKSNRKKVGFLIFNFRQILMLLAARNDL